jgi:hypothetical protein
MIREEEGPSTVTLLNAPAYNPARDNLIRNFSIGGAVLVFLLIVLTLAGYIAGHGWLFTNLGYEHRVNDFFTDLEKKDYTGAFGLYNNDPDWQKHPAQYSGYPLARFTEDWTTHSPVDGPILSHHVDVSKTDGTGAFGTGIIVAVKVNDSKELFMYVNRSDKTMTWPAPHELTRY